MNRIFKVVFDRVHRRLIVVSELAKSTTKTGRKLVKTACVATATLALSAHAFAESNISETHAQSINNKKEQTIKKLFKITAHPTRFISIENILRYGGFPNLVPAQVPDTTVFGNTLWIPHSTDGLEAMGKQLVINTENANVTDDDPKSQAEYGSYNTNIQAIANHSWLSGNNIQAMGSNILVQKNMFTDDPRSIKPSFVKNVQAIGDGVIIGGNNEVAIGTGSMAAAYNAPRPTPEHPDTNPLTNKSESEIHNNLSSYDGSVAIGAVAQATSNHNNATALGSVATANGSIDLLDPESTTGSTNSNGSIAIGNRSAGRQGAIAIGANSTAYYNSLALGQDAKTVMNQYTAPSIANDAMAIGNRAVVGADGGVALGMSTTVSIKNSIALGDYVTTTNGNAVTHYNQGDIEFGNWANWDLDLKKVDNTDGSSYWIGQTNQMTHEAKLTGVISVGGRQINQVAAGQVNENSTDAINGSQLYSTNKVLANVATSLKDILGGNAKINSDGTISMSNIGGTKKNTIEEAIASLKGGKGSGTSGESGTGTGTGTGGLTPEQIKDLEKEIKQAVTDATGAATKAADSAGKASKSADAAEKAKEAAGKSADAAGHSADSAKAAAVAARTIVNNINSNVSGAVPVQYVDPKGTQLTKDKNGKYVPISPNGRAYKDVNGTYVPVNDSGVPYVKVGDKYVPVDQHGQPYVEKDGKYVPVGYVKADNGKYYSASDLDHGKVKADALTNGVEPVAAAKGISAKDVDSIQNQVTVSVKGDAKQMGNVASSLVPAGQGDNAPLTADQAKAVIAGQDGKSGLLAEKGAKALDKVATARDLQALAQAGLDFTGNNGTVIHRALGTKLTVKGEGNLGANTKTAANNIYVEAKDDALTIKLAQDLQNLHSVSVSSKVTVGSGDKQLSLDGDKGVITAGSGDKQVAIDGTKATVTAGTGANRVTLDGSKAGITAGSGDKQVTIDGTKATVTAGTGASRIALDGSKAEITAGEGDKQVTIDGAKATVSAGTGANRVTFNGSNGEVTTGSDATNNKVVIGGQNGQVTTGNSTMSRDGFTVANSDGSQSTRIDQSGVTLQNNGQSVHMAVHKDKHGNATMHLSNNKGQGVAITGLVDSNDPSSAVTRGYVDRSLAGIKQNLDAGVDRKINHLRQDMNHMNRDLRAGIAASAAMGLLDTPNIAGKSTLSAASAYYKGQGALSIGYARRSDNGNWVVKSAFSVNSQKDDIIGAGVSYTW